VIEVAASYVAARVQGLGLGADPAPDLGRANQHNGLDVSTCSGMPWPGPTAGKWAC